MVDFPIKTSIYKGFSMAMLVITRWYWFLQLNHPMVVPNDFTQNWDPSARWDFMEEHPEEEKNPRNPRRTR